MPVQIKLGGFFDKAKRDAAASNAVRKAIREYARYVPEKQIKSKPTGKLYRRKGGKGFIRSHRASRSGQPPAVDTGKLIRSTVPRMLTNLKGQVVTFAMTPDGFDYASFLEFEMNRPMQHSPEDVKAAQEILDKHAAAEMGKLR
jgi:hypothetical protein